MKELGLEPAGDGGGFRQAFPVRTGMKVEPATALKLGGKALARDAFQPLGFSAQGKASGAAGARRLRDRRQGSGIDDYAGVDVQGRSSSSAASCPSTPALATPDRQRRSGDLRQKAWLARERGARALLVVDRAGAPEDRARGLEAAGRGAAPGARARGLRRRRHPGA